MVNKPVRVPGASGNSVASWKDGLSEQCTAHSSQRLRAVQNGEMPPDTDTRCQRSAIKGHHVCSTHGGSISTTKAAAQRNLAERRFTSELAQVADMHLAAPVDNPLAALQQLAGEILTMKNIFAMRVAKLKEAGYGSKAGEQLKADVAVYERALDRCGKVLTDIARLNIDDRLAKIEEKQAELMVAVFIEAVSRMGMGERQAEARRIISGILERQ